MKDALNVGTTAMPKEVFWVLVIVIAPGGKLITIWEAHMMIDRANSIGAAPTTAGLRSEKGFDLMENRSSIVDTYRYSESALLYGENVMRDSLLEATPPSTYPSK